MSTQEARAFRNSLHSPADRSAKAGPDSLEARAIPPGVSPVSPKPTLSENSTAPKSAFNSVVPSKVEAGNPSPSAAPETEPKNTKPIAPSPEVVASNQNSPHNSFVDQNSPAGAPTPSKSAPPFSSGTSYGNQSSAVPAKAMPDAYAANVAASRQSVGAPRPVPPASSVMQPPSGVNYPTHDNAVATAKVPASGGAASNVAPAKVAPVNAAPAPTIAKSNASTVVPNSNASPTPSLTSSSLLAGQPKPAGASPSLAPASVQGPLHGVMMVARKNDESFLLKLPAESVPGGKSTSIRMQRVVMVPAESRWHHHGPIAKVTVGELLSQAALDRADPGIQPHPGDVVSVRLFVDKEGTVEELKPMSGRLALMPRVMRSVRDWQFDQTLIDGKPVESEVDITVEFRPNS